MMNGRVLVIVLLLVVCRTIFGSTFCGTFLYSVKIDRRNRTSGIGKMSVQDPSENSKFRSEYLNARFKKLPDQKENSIDFIYCPTQCLFLQVSLTYKKETGNTARDSRKKVYVSSEILFRGWCADPDTDDDNLIYDNLCASNGICEYDSHGILHINSNKCMGLVSVYGQDELTRLKIYSFVQKCSVLACEDHLCNLEALQTFFPKTVGMEEENTAEPTNPIACGTPEYTK